MLARLIDRRMRTAPALPSTACTGPPAPRRALLVQPFYPKDPRTSFGKHVLAPGQALLSIAAATPAGWQVAYWDENLLQGPPSAYPVPQVVGITVHLTFADRAYELARWYRRRGAKVILGGLHVASCPDEAAEHADAVAIGDGVAMWPEILGDAEQGRLRRVYRADFRRSCDDDPPPRRDLLPGGSFLTPMSVIATRGCHNRCAFCYLSTRGVRMPYAVRPVEQVADQIRASGEPYVVFTDNNLGSEPHYLRGLCRALRPLEIIWSAAVSLDVTDDPSLVAEMALAGCTGVFVGLETLETANLREARKRSAAAEQYAGRVAVFRDCGIQVNGSFVFGFDHDRPDVFERTVAWIEENRLECATFHILTPYPGTPLFERLEAEGRLLHKDWRLYDTGHAVFRPRHMTPEELEAGYGWCYRRLFSHRSIWRRRPANARAVLPYLAMSYLYKRANGLWYLLIRRRLVAAAWRPLVECSRRRHLRFRRELQLGDLDLSGPAAPDGSGSLVTAGV
jgi:radical SAM superfamily enzyme YgiQ (UPF0313 family)